MSRFFAYVAVVAVLVGLSSAYTAAVLEHEAISGTSSSALQTMNANLDVIEPSVKSAASQGADIILLSEMAITSLIKSRSEMYDYLEQLPPPNLGRNSTACGNAYFNTRPILQRLSCMAVNHSIYIAANWGDILPCNRQTDHNCPSDNHYQFNTEVVFDRSGQVVAKYYKIHTFDATEFDTPKTEKYVYFMLDNTKIGIITCFDSMYGTPLLPLIKNEGISNFIVSHWWNNQYAMFSAASWWQAVSRRMKINLMASATWWTKSTEYTWSSGSGIYSGGNIRATWYNHARSQEEKLMVASLSSSGGPASDLPSPSPYLQLKSKPGAMCVQKTEWTASSLEPGKDYSASVKCGDFTCSVDFKISKLDTENKEYWFLYTDTGYYIVPDGNNVYYYEEFCTFYKCYLTSGCLTSSEQMKDDTGATVFDHITVSGTYQQGSTQFVMAAGGNGDVYPDVMSKIDVTNHGSTTTAATSSNFDDTVINISILGRKYSLDGVYN